MSDENLPTSPNSQKKAVGRGVSYPFIGLEEAVEKARAFYVEERKSAAPVASAVKHFGYGESSSGGRSTISALLQFGLLEDEGRKEDRHVKLTDRALNILLDLPDSPERIKSLQECVRMPKLYAKLLEKYSDELPSDHSIGYHLQRDYDFNPKTLHSFISDFRDSLAFAKLGKMAQINQIEKLDAPIENMAVTNQVTQTANPQQNISRDSINTVTSAPSAQLITNLAFGAKQDTFTLDEGQVVLQWPSQMSNTSYEDFKDWIDLQMRKIKRSVQ